VNFKNDWNQFSITYAKGNDTPASVAVYLDSLDTAPVATVALTGTGSWSTSSTITVPWSSISGEHNVYLLFQGGAGVGNIDKVAFGAPTGLGPNLLANSEFESGTSGWFSWGGTLATTTNRAYAGTQSLVLTGRTSGGSIATDITNVVSSGGTYQVTFWASVGGADSANVNLTRKLVCDGVTTYAWLVNPKAVTNGSWVELTGTFKVPTCTTISQLQIYAEGPGAGVDLYVDHVSLRSPSNLLSNGTFESNTSGWFTWSGTLSTTTALAHGGSRSLLVGSRTGNAPAVVDVTSVVTCGASYAVTFWVSVGNATTANVNLTQKVVYYPNATATTATTTYGWMVNPTAVTAGSWAKLSGTLTVPSCTTLSQVYIYDEGPGAGIDLYVDDVTLSK
jgi:hypothetical protein